MRQQGRRKASGHLDRRKKKETDGRAGQQQRKKQQQLPENPRIPPSTTEQKLSSVNLLEDSSDDEDKPTDYELLLSTFKPLTKKPRLTEGGREKIKDTTIRKSISGGGEEGFHVTVQEGWGGGVIEEGEGLAGSAGDEDSCSGDDRTDEVAAGIGKKYTYLCVFCVLYARSRNVALRTRQLKEKGSENTHHISCTHA